MNKSMIIGIFFLLLGISILLKVIFHVNLPLARIAFAFFLIYAGVRMLAGPWGEREDRHGVRVTTGSSSVFSDSKFSAHEDTRDHQSYNIVFGRGSLDLSKIGEDKIKDRDLKVEINTVFGEAVVRINPKLPLVIRSNSIFAESRMPDGNMVAFGTLGYQSPSVKNATHKVIVENNVVFGSAKFSEHADVEKPAKAESDEEE